MDFIIVLAIIGFFINVFNKAKDSNYNENESTIKKIINKIPVETIEKNISPDVVEDLKSFIGYSNKTKKKHTKHKQNKPQPKEKIKVLYEEEDIIKVVTSKKPIVENTLNHKVKKENSKKKNPFYLTKNPVTNAVIASEILGKPKCKK